MKVELYNEGNKYAILDVSVDGVSGISLFIANNGTNGVMYYDIPDCSILSVGFTDDIGIEERRKFLISMNRRMSYLRASSNSRTPNDVALMYMYDYLMFSFVEIGDRKYIDIISTIYGGSYGGNSDPVLQFLFDFYSSNISPVDNDTYCIPAEYFKQYIKSYIYNGSSLLDIINNNISDDLDMIWSNTKNISNKDSKVLMVKSFLNIPDDVYLDIFRGALSFSISNQ